MAHKLFDRKLNGEIHKYKAETGMKMYDIADACDINRQRLYNFSSGHGTLNGDEVKRLMNELGIDIEFKTQSQ